MVMQKTKEDVFYSTLWRRW